MGDPNVVDEVIDDPATIEQAMADTAPGATPAPCAQTMTFYDALQHVAVGKQITRQSWPARDVVYLYADILHIRKADGSLHKLIVSSGDIEATDWLVANLH